MASAERAALRTAIRTLSSALPIRRYARASSRTSAAGPSEAGLFLCYAGGGAMTGTTSLPPALSHAIREAVAEGIRDALSQAPSPQAADTLLDAKAVAARLGVSVRTLDRLVARGAIRPLLVGRQRRFHPATVDAYVRESARSRGGAR